MATFTTTWNAAFDAAPDGSTVDANTLDTVISTFKGAVRERLAQEHDMVVGDTANQGKHLAGSAKAYYQSAAPTTAPGGDALGAEDAGRVWVDSDTHGSYVYNGSSFVQTGIACKIVEIGDWNMAIPGDATVAHGLTLSTIRFVSAIIRNDDDDEYRPLCGSLVNSSGSYGGGGISVDGTNVTLTHAQLSNSDGFYTTAYNATSYNRGWITIWYEA